MRRYKSLKDLEKQKTRIKVIGGELIRKYAKDGDTAAVEREMSRIRLADSIRKRYSYNIMDSKAYQRDEKNRHLKDYKFGRRYADYQMQGRATGIG